MVQNRKTKNKKANGSVEREIFDKIVISTEDRKQTKK